MKSHEGFQNNHKTNLITLELEKLAYNKESSSGAEAVSESSHSCAMEWVKKRPNAIISHQSLQEGDRIRVINTKSIEEGLFAGLVVTAAGVRNGGRIQKLVY